MFKSKREGTDPLSENAEGHPEGLQLEIMNQNHENPDPLMEKTTKTCLRKKTKYNCAVVRRSLRFQNGILPAGNENTEPVLEDTTAGESGSAEEQPTHKMHGSTSGEKSLEEKVDYIMQLLEARNSKVLNLFTVHPSMEIISIFVFSYIYLAVLLHCSPFCSLIGVAKSGRG